MTSASEESDNGAPKQATKDAGYEDVFKPVRLAARDEQDLAVLSALLQDAIARSGDMAFLPKERRFALIASRYRWEEPEAQERVRVGVHFDTVLRAQVKGLDPSVKDQPVSLLAVRFEPAAEPPGGVIHIACAGGIEAALEVEAIEGALSDLSQPWAAKRRPEHEGE